MPSQVRNGACPPRMFCLSHQSDAIEPQHTHTPSARASVSDLSQSIGDARDACRHLQRGPTVIQSLQLRRASTSEARRPAHCSRARWPRHPAHARQPRADPFPSSSRFGHAPHRRDLDERDIRHQKGANPRGVKLVVKGYVEHAGLVSSAQFALHEGSPGSSAKQTDSQAVGGSGVCSSGGPMRGRRVLPHFAHRQPVSKLEGGCLLPLEQPEHEGARLC